ncbi:MAG: right-handed parallel beta-helix repeat-containing protein [Planctomycetota bacterium]
MNLRDCFLGIATAFLLMANLPAEDLRIHVAPQGDDRNDGSQVRPLASLQAAQQRVREQVAAGYPGRVEVVISEGVWRLSQTWQFDQRDASRQTPVTYRAESTGEVKICGGQELTGWQKEGEFWIAKLPAATPSQGPLRRLSIEGRLAPRATEPDEDWYRLVRAGPDRRTAFYYALEGFVQPNRPLGTELVFLHDWSITRVALKQIDLAEQQLAFRHAIGGDLDFFAIDGFEPHARYRLENDRAFADQPGEWYHDLATQQLAIRADPGALKPPHVVLPQVATLLQVRGTAAEPVRGLAFCGLTLSETACTLPATGGAEVQAGFFQPRGEGSTAGDWLNRLAPAVELAFTEDCLLQGCRFEQLGGGGIYIHQQSHRNRIEACVFRELGGGAAMLGDPDPPRNSAGDQLICRDNELRQSSISQCGQILHGSVGVWIGLAAGTKIENNEISQLPYTGVSVGWQWNPEPTGCRDNLVAGNRIHHVMQLLSDGGAIYTLGRQPGTVLRDNQIHDVPLNAGRAESNGIFMDEGSSLILVTGNEISNTARAPIRFHKARELTVQNNRLHLAPEVQPFTFNATDPASIVTEPNIITGDR